MFPCLVDKFQQSLQKTVTFKVATEDALFTYYPPFVALNVSILTMCHVFFAL